MIITKNQVNSISLPAFRQQFIDIFKVAFPNKTEAEAESYFDTESYLIDFYLDGDLYHIDFYVTDLESPQIIAFIVYTINKFNECEIMQLATSESHQKKGYSSALLKNLFEKIEKLKEGVIYLEVAENNKAAINLYNKMGFEQHAIRKDYYRYRTEHGIEVHNGILMRKINPI